RQIPHVLEIHNIKRNKPIQRQINIFLLIHPATYEIYTPSLHDALPICQNMPLIATSIICSGVSLQVARWITWLIPSVARSTRSRDRKSTRLNSSHVKISYAVFCLKKKSKAARLSSKYARSYTSMRTGHE